MDKKGILNSTARRLSEHGHETHIHDCTDGYVLYTTADQGLVEREAWHVIDQATTAGLIDEEAEDHNYGFGLLPQRQTDNAGRFSVYR